MQAAELFFGADAHPHDYLHEVLFRLLAVGWIAAATQNLVNKVGLTPDVQGCKSQGLVTTIFSECMHENDKDCCHQVPRYWKTPAT